MKAGKGFPRDLSGTHGGYKAKDLHFLCGSQGLGVFLGQWFPTFLRLGPLKQFLMCGDSQP